MIANFRNKGLKLFYERGDASRLQSQHVNKMRVILTRIDAATNLKEMNVPGYDLHQLNGAYKKFESVKVDKNHRIIFKIKKQEAIRC